jgi:hypothetical protein
VQALGINIPSFYLPATKQTLFWDAPTLAHTGIDIDYKMTAYDWDDRDLTWSVASGPSGMTIDADGTLHWTPSVEGSEAVTVECSLGGQQTLSKTFTCAVDNSRCVFLATDGDDTTGDGTITSPYATIEKVAAIVKGSSLGRTVYHRAGEYTKTDWTWTGTGANADLLAWQEGWTEGGPLVVRNYPGEEVKYILAGVSSGWRIFNSYIVLCGMDVDGGASTTNQGEAGGVVLWGKSVAKRIRCYNYSHNTNNNCTGFQLRTDTLIDQCQGWDNYDRDRPNFHNNSNFLFYGTGNGSVPAYAIDCLSDGIASRKSGCGFKLKHAGDLQPIFHKCADTGTLRPFNGQGRKMVLRNSFFYSAIGSVLNHLDTDASTGGVNNTDEGYLVENNVIFGASNDSLLTLAWWNQATTDANPPFYAGNDFINLENTSAGNFLMYGEFSANAVPDNWDIKFKGNRIFTGSPSNAVIVQASTSALTTVTSKGSGTTLLGAAPDYTFSAAGRDFQIVGGVCSEVGV